MSKPKTALKEPNIDQRLIDERGPTKERMKGAEFEVGDTGIITLRQSPIDRAVSRGTFTERQGEAARKFYRHWYESGVGMEVHSIDLERVPSGDNCFGNMAKSEAQAGHRHMLRRAMRAVYKRADVGGCRGDHPVGLLILIVCAEIPFLKAGETLPGFEFRGRDAEVMARTILRSALNILIDEWGL